MWELYLIVTSMLGAWMIGTGIGHGLLWLCQEISDWCEDRELHALARVQQRYLVDAEVEAATEDVGPRGGD